RRRTGASRAGPEPHPHRRPRARVGPRLRAGQRRAGPPARRQPPARAQGEDVDGPRPSRRGRRRAGAADDALLVGSRMLLDVVSRGSAAGGTDAIESYATAHADDTELRELAGDIFFAARDYRRALRQYAALADGTPARSVLVKAADASERLGDTAG